MVFSSKKMFFSQLSIDFNNMSLTFIALSSVFIFKSKLSDGITRMPFASKRFAWMKLNSGFFSA